MTDGGASLKVLVIGGGGREHALAWKLASSPRVAEVIVAPGNAGTAAEPRCRNLPVAADDVTGLLALAKNENIDFTVVGPELALAAGVVDAFTSAGLAIFGPTRAAAEIESSKAFAKDFFARHRIPTAGYRVFDALTPALEYLASSDLPIVVKADGLAAGKGVTVATTQAAAMAAVTAVFGGTAGSSETAGARVVIEEFLHGEELSYIVIAAGTRYQPLASAQDHKRIFDGDRGPNTGGMGAYSPASLLTPELDARVRREVIEPTLAGLAAEGRPFTGFLYAGLMIDAAGAPWVIEFNARLGDPETQPILLRFESDLLGILQSSWAGDPLREVIRWKPQAALAVVLAAQGYPGKVKVGDVIQGLEASVDDCGRIFHAGTARIDGSVVTAGGRVLCACGLGDTLLDAQDEAYRVAARINWDGMQYRTDIGWRAIEAEQAPASL